uniref:acetyl-CoA carboxylase biotin carboxyl carrier protein subunit n=1 Tax=Nocardioides sp. TaxID=35761 RepID=UPI002B266A13
AMARVEQTVAQRTVQSRIPSGWRNVVSAPQVEVFQLGETEVRVGWQRGRRGPELADVHDEVSGVRLVSATPVARGTDGWRVAVDHEGLSTVHQVRLAGDRVDVDSPWGHLPLVAVPRFVDPADAVASGSLLAPMPGTVVKVAVESGQEVAAGDVVLVLEAMKMQHTVTAPTAGTVTEINVQPGAQVAAGEVLAVVEGEEQ